MNTQDMERVKQALQFSNINNIVIDETMHDIQFETTVSTLAARLRGGYGHKEIISNVLGATINFYDADCAMVISVDVQLQLAKCLYEAHRDDFMPICGTQPMYLNEYLEIQQAVKQMGPLTIPDVLSMLPPESKSYKRMEAIGIRSVMALPYSKRNTGMVAVINPRKFTAHNSMLQILSYVTVAEINKET